VSSVLKPTTKQANFAARGNKKKIDPNIRNPQDAGVPQSRHLPFKVDNNFDAGFQRLRLS